MSKRSRMKYPEIGTKIDAYSNESKNIPRENTSCSCVISRRENISNTDVSINCPLHTKKKTMRECRCIMKITVLSKTVPSDPSGSYNWLLSCTSSHTMQIATNRMPGSAISTYRVHHLDDRSRLYKWNKAPISTDTTWRQRRILRMTNNSSISSSDSETAERLLLFLWWRKR